MTDLSNISLPSMITRFIKKSLISSSCQAISEPPGVTEVRWHTILLTARHIKRAHPRLNPNRYRL